MKNTVNITDKKNPNDNGHDVFRLWLQKQFAERCKRNSRYSLRAFAHYLSLDASSLSQILSGKRRLSKKGIQKICDKLPTSPSDLMLFGLVSPVDSKNESFLQLEIDAFTVISEWYHYAILELTYVVGFVSDAKWISRKLSITVEEVKSAIERLRRLGLLTEVQGSLVKTTKRHTNKGRLNTSAAHKELQRQVITKALIAIDECPQDEKDITSMTMAIDTRNLEKARLLIQKFRRDLCELLEEGKPEQVFNLAIQLYPISNRGEIQ